jgi:hypothetical protein
VSVSRVASPPHLEEKHTTLTHKHSAGNAYELDTEPVSCIILLWMGLTQSLTEMSTRNLPGGKGRLARGADNLNTICVLIV